ncbi:MAG: aminopeptidase P family protein [Oligoflexia bacterium]|nr:aminopeptidase P family protein [Oligoflexia bacterium]
MNVNYLSRIRRVISKLKTLPHSSVMVLSSAPQTIRSRDTYYHYRANSDFYYLTGSEIQDCSLLLSSEHKRPILIAPPHSPIKQLWEGKQPSPKELAANLGAELIVAKDMQTELRVKVKNHEHLIYQNTAGTQARRLAQYLFELPSHERGALPLHFSHSDSVLEPLRLIKEPAEVALIRRANAITNQALGFVAEQVAAGMYEYEVARTIEYVFGMNGATCGFGTIVASGPSAATLHYESMRRKLKKDELLLIDCGAEYEMYSGDITRVIPVSGLWSPIQRDLYSCVLAAQKAALREVRHGVKILKVYNAAARVLTEGLKGLKVLRGKTSDLLSKKAFRPYFPHGIGHSLGLDVHDLSHHRGNNEATLTEGMVFTIEPGLYFSKAVGRVPACGIRIEDNVLVTKRGCEILSPGFPKEISDISSLMQA